MASRPGSSRSARMLLDSENLNQSERGSKPLELDNDKCSCCFSLKGAMITTISILVIVSGIIIIIDAVILEEDRLAEYHSDSHRLEISIHGTPDSVVKIDSFKSFQPSQKYYTRVKIIDLNYVEVNVDDLLRFIANPYRLEIVRLRNVTLIGKLQYTITQLQLGKRYMHESGSLKEFTLELNQAIGPSASFQLDQCDQCVVEKDADSLDTFQDKECIKSFFHLLISRSHYEDQPNIVLPDVLQGVKISIKINGWTYFKLDPELGEVTTVLNNCNQILKDISLSTRKLSIKSCNDLEYSTLSDFASTVTHLTLNTVNMTEFSPNRTFSNLLGKFVNLQELIIKHQVYDPLLFKYIYDIRYSLIEKSHILYSLNDSSKYRIDFSDLPLTLKNITVSDTILTANQTIRLKLNQLALYDVAFEDEITLKNLLSSNAASCKRIAWQSSVNPFPHGKIPFNWIDVLADMITNGPNNNLEWLFLDTTLVDTDESKSNFLINYYQILNQKLFQWDRKTNFLRSMGSSLILKKDIFIQNRIIPWDIEENIDPKNIDRLKKLWSEFFGIDKFLDERKILESDW